MHSYYSRLVENSKWKLQPFFATELGTQGHDGEPQPIHVVPQIKRESFLLFKAVKQLKKVAIEFVWLTIDGDTCVLGTRGTECTHSNIKAQAISWI